MAKVTIAGDAVVVTSVLKLEDLKTVAKYRPEQLTLYGGEDGKEPVFAIGITDGPGVINAYGASFGRESHDEAKLAQITLNVDGSVEDVKAYVADKFGGAIININKLEEKLPGVIDEINAEKSVVLDSIEIVG